MDRDGTSPLVAAAGPRAPAGVRGAVVGAGRAVGASGRSPLRLGLLLAAVLAASPVLAQGALDDELTLRQRAEIHETRERARADHEQVLADCARRWAMNDCVSRAREQLRGLLRPLQEAEQVLDDDRRLRRAAQRQRAADRRRTDGTP
ncbi:MAG: hypothetical protein RIQ53_1735 [Pseudomonadota bacterium]